MKGKGTREDKSSCSVGLTSRAFVHSCLRFGKSIIAENKQEDR